MTSDTLDFLRWIDEHGPSRDEALERWQTSCPRASTWEDAWEDGLLELTAQGVVRLTDAARKLVAG